MGLGHWGALVFAHNGAWGLSLTPNIFNPPPPGPRPPPPPPPPRTEQQGEEQDMYETVETVETVFEGDEKRTGSGRQVSGEWGGHDNDDRGHDSVDGGGDGDDLDDDGDDDDLFEL